jgi:hypothetical protein
MTALVKSGGAGRGEWAGHVRTSQKRTQIQHSTRAVGLPELSGWQLQQKVIANLGRGQVYHLVGQLSATSLVCTFDDLPKPVFATVLGLEIGVESRVIWNAAIGRQSRAEDRRAGQVASGIRIGF